MERQTKLICFTFALALLVAPSAFADTTVNFTDTHKYWLEGESGNWSNGQGTSYGWNDDITDYIGTPNFTDGSITYNGSKQLTNITIRYTNGSSLETPGDLFIDYNADNLWDYVVKLYNATGSGSGGTTYNVYAVNIDAHKGVNDSNYVLSGHDNVAPWAGYVIRDNSPVAANESLLTPGNKVGTAEFSGWSLGFGPNTSTFTFGVNSGLHALGSQMALAWEPNCANDVLWERVPTSTPETSTVLLLSGGLIGLFASRRRLIEQMQG